MPNYNLVANSQFKARNFEDMIRPYAMYTQEYRAQENAIADLATKADVWAGLANEQTDPVAYAQYTNYANSLKDLATIMADRGLDPSSRQEMLNLKRRYSSEIVPIEQAYTARKAQAEEQRKALLQNPTLMISRRADTTSLDQYLENPNLGYDSYSGALLAQQTGQAAAAIAKELRNYGKGKSLDEFTRTWLQQHGYTAGEVAFAINHPNDPRASNVLTTIVNNVIADSGIANWADNKTLNQAYNYARQGLWQAVGQTQVGTYTDQAAVIRAQKPTRQNVNGKFALNPSNIYSNRELSEEERKYKNNVKNYSKYFYTDAQNRVRLTPEGLREYRRNATPKVTTSGSGGGTARLINAETKMEQTNRPFTPTPFKKFLDSIGGSMRMEEGAGYSSNRIGKLWENYVSNSPAAKTAMYDATKITEYIYDVPQSEEYQKNYKGKLSRVIGSDETFTEVDYDAKTNTWVPTGKTLSFANFDTNDYNIVARAPSEIGTSLFIKKKGEKAKRYLAPPGINLTAESARDAALSDMLKTQRLLQRQDLSDQQRAKLENYYDDLTQQQIMFESQLDFTNQTSTQNFKPYYIP